MGMKKTMVFLVLSLYLISTTELYQLLKLPAFVEHFTAHQKQDKNISLWQFVSLHYANGDLKDADHAQDMKLPFKTHDNCNFINLNVLVPQLNFSIMGPYSVMTTKIVYGYKQPFSDYRHLSSIWQPPKIS